MHLKSIAAAAALFICTAGVASANSVIVGNLESFERTTAAAACAVTDSVPAAFLKHHYAAKRASGAWFGLGENEEFITYSHNELDGVVNGNANPTNFWVYGAPTVGKTTIRDVVELTDCANVPAQPE